MFSVKTAKPMAEKKKEQFNADAFDSLLGEGPRLVVAEFFSKNCVPCKLMRADLEEIDREYSGRLNLVRINVANSAELAARFSVVSTPTIIMFAGGKPVSRILGYLSRHDLKDRIDEQLKQIT
jgi:thioredoxin 1